MNFDTIPDDLTTYIIMFWFVAMPVGLAALGWWCYFNARAIRKHKQIADNNLATEVCSDISYREAMEKHNDGIIRIIQSHTAAIAALEARNIGFASVIQQHTSLIVDLQNHFKSKPPKSLKDKVLAASKRNGKRGRSA